jgi:hypothetical protein
MITLENFTHANTRAYINLVTALGRSTFKTIPEFMDCLGEVDLTPLNKTDDPIGYIAYKAANGVTSKSLDMIVENCVGMWFYIYTNKATVSLIGTGNGRKERVNKGYEFCNNRTSVAVLLLSPDTPDSALA